MPVTKTAKRALRSSKEKEAMNKLIVSKMEIAIRKLKKTRSKKDFQAAVSRVDKAAKKKIIHKNKAARIKSQLSKLVAKKKARVVSTKKT